MSELTQTLKILVTRYPGTMAELARKALIDRSTLYKIVSGQRTPREFQLEHLADALELSEEEKSALLLQYKQRGRGPDPRLRAELHHLLEVSFRVEDFTHHEGLISNEAASQLRCSEQYIEGSRAVAAAVASLVANHILSGDTRPLLLSPFTNPMLVFAENRDIPREWVSGVSVLTRTLPFLFLPKLNYEARVVPSVMTEPSPGTLMPVYLLLPKAAVMMDIQGQKAYIIMDRQAVENLRLAFSRKYLNAASVLKLATDAHDFSESIALYNDLFSEKRRCSMIRYQPPFALFADEKMALQLVRPGAALQSLPALLEHLQMWSAQAPDLYFCEEGLLQFVRTGKMFDIPPDLCDVPDIPTRRELLLRLRRAAESDRRTLRIVDSAQLAPTPSMSVNVFQGRGVVFCQAIREPDGQYCREYLMQDPILTEALLTYLDDGHASDWLRSQKYTLDFIDYCLRLL